MITLSWNDELAYTIMPLKSNLPSHGTHVYIIILCSYSGIVIGEF